MRSPEAARALPELVAAGVLTPERAAPLAAVARGERVSIRAELRALVALAVTALGAGATLFVRTHPDALGVWPVALLLALAAAAPLIVLLRRAAPFSWSAAPDRDWIDDGLVLLAISLTGATLAWLEWRVALLGASWSWHLLLVALVAAALALRFDSIPGWTLALSTFAAWRGVALWPTADRLERTLFGWERDDLLRVNLVGCAALFALLAALAVHLRRKPHFEPATTLLATLAAATAFASGLGDSALWPLHALALIGLGLAVARFAFARRRLGLFALAAFAVYVGVSRFVLEVAGDGVALLGCFWFAATTVGAIALLVVVHRRFAAAERADAAAAAPESARDPEPSLPADERPRR